MPSGGPEMTQLELPYRGRRVNVDGYYDEKTGVHYIGEAQETIDGFWRCLADVNGALCVVECNVWRKDV